MYISLMNGDDSHQSLLRKASAAYLCLQLHARQLEAFYAFSPVSNRASESAIHWTFPSDLQAQSTKIKHMMLVRTVRVVKTAKPYEHMYKLKALDFAL